MNDRLTFVTGAHGGIGRAVCDHLVAEGHRLCIIVRTKAQAVTCQTLWKLDDDHMIVADLADRSAVERAAERMADVAEAHKGPLALVTCSGITNSSPIDFPDWDGFEETIRVNAIAPLCLSQALLPHMRTRGGGRIVHVSSVEGHMTFPFVGAYSASKHALEAICSVLRLEGAIDGLQVTSVVPGFVNTPIWSKAEAIDLNRFAASRHYETLQRVRPRFLEMGRKGLDPARVGRAVTKALGRRKAPRQIVIVQVYLLEWVLARAVPPRLREWAIRKFVGV